MKKTFTANLNGTVFHIEEDAYDQLQRYLANIRAKFSGSKEAEEIMADIEARIAELFTERLQGRQAVSMADVDHVKQVMGQPEDYVDGDTSDAGPTGSDQWESAPGQRRHKRLFRDTEDRWVAGVIGGIANYFGTEALWFRIAFIVVVIAGWGTPVFLYILMWILVPEASTAAEKLEMRGEPVTVDNIKRVFEEGAERMKSGAEKMADEARNIGRNWGRNHPGAASHAATVVTKVAGILLVLVALGLLTGLVTALIGGTVSLWQATWSTDHAGLFDLGGYLFTNKTHAWLFAIGCFLLITIPVYSIFMAGFRLLRGTPAPRWLGWTLGFIWFASLALVVVTSATLANDFRRETTVRTLPEIQQPAGNVLYLDMLPVADSLQDSWTMEYNDGRMDADLWGIHVEKGVISGAWAELDVKESPDSLFHLVVLREARGSTVKEAANRAGNVQYHFTQSGDALRFSPILSFSAQDKFRVQGVRYVVQVPLGKSVFLREGTKHMLDDVDNTSNTYDADMVGRRWTMTVDGLQSADAPEPGKRDQEPAPKEDSTAPHVPAAPASPASITAPNLIHLLTAGLRP
jgi:phage shock protein PspC (stress-responsive transcriptional regulator)